MTKGAYSSIVDISERDSYLIPNSEVRGIGAPYVQKGSYFDASKPFDPAVLAGSGITLAQIPSPIANKWIHLPDGSVTAPGLAFAGETNSGRYRIGSNNVGETINSDLVFDWNATRLRLDSGFSLDITDMTLGSVLFAGTGGRVSQDNSNFFWDDTNNRLGIGCNDPFRTLEARHASLSQLVLSTDANNGIMFRGGSIGLTVEHYNNLGVAPFYYFTGDENAQVLFKVDNTDTGAAAAAAYQVEVQPGSGDALLNWNVSGTRNYSAGIDNSDSDNWKFCLGAVLGTTNIITITSGGYTTYTPLAASSGTGYGFTITGPINTGGSNGLFKLTNGLSTGQTASTEIAFVNFDLSTTTTWATGAIADERAFKIMAPTLAFAGASVVTRAATLYIDRAPQAGSNATLSNAYAIWVDDGLCRFDGGITFSSFTLGSVLFAGTGGALTEDNTNFFWDDTSNFLRLTSTAGKQLHLRYDASNHIDFAVSSAGVMTSTVTGTSPAVTYTASHTSEFALTLSNTNSGASAAAVAILSTPSTGADSYFSIRISGGSRWAVGIDNSDSDAFKIVPGTTPSDTAAIKIDTSRNIFFPDFSQGSVLFIGASGEVIENNASLFWDNSDVSLSISKNDTATTPTLDLIQDSTGDSALRFAIGVTNSYAVGADNSDSDKWKVSWAGSGSAALGTNDYLTLSTAGLFTVSQYQNVGTTTDAAAQGDFAAGTTQKLFWDESLGFLQLTSTVSKQIRLAYTSGSVYTDITTNSSGQVTISPTGNRVYITSTMESIGLAIPFQSIDQTTGPVACRFKNTGGDFYFGIEDSTGSFFGATAYDAVFFTASPFKIMLSGTSRFYAASAGVAVGVASLATTATNGFLYVPACAGAPSGTPTGMTGYAPIVVDTSNNKLYFYSGGSWRDAGP